MLSTLLFLALAPQADAPVSRLRPIPLPPGDRAPGDVRVIGMTPANCRNPLIRADGPPARAGMIPLASQGDVALYRLLDRYINGCPAPVIVRYRVPGSDAVGRVIGAPDP